MRDLTLVVLAAGMGSRFGGLKQIEPMGPMGELIVDYSIYDAVRAGFNKVVFIIKEENFQIFKDVIGDRISKQVRTEYVFQELSDLMEGISIPDGREKPWGTVQALLCCEKVLGEDFCVINADDFYGSTAFEHIYKYMQETPGGDGKIAACMSGYQLGNTISANGSVSRGICQVDKDGFLTEIVERKTIDLHDGKICYTMDGESFVPLGADTPVSMNFWGFEIEILSEFRRIFKEFLGSDMQKNPLKSECILSTAIDELLRQGKVEVKVLENRGKWFGVTYLSDKESVSRAIRDEVMAGKYPLDLTVGY